MKTIKLIAVAFLAFSIQCTTPNPSQKDKQGVTTENSIKNQVENGAFIVDVRTVVEYKLGHFEGAVNIPLSDVESKLNEFKGKENIIVYCRSGNRSGKAKAILEANGFTNVTNGISQAHLEEEVK